MSNLFTKLALPATLIIAGALVTSGCGGTKAAATTVNASNGFAAFQSCLKDHGVTMPGGGPGGGGPPPGSGGQGAAPAGGPPPGGSAQNGAPAGGPPPGGGGFGGGRNLTAAQQKAFQACRSKMPNGGRPPQMTAAQQKQFAAQRAKMQACLTKAGVKLPTRGAQGGYGGGQRPQMTAAQQQAMQTCGQQVGGFGGRGGPGGGPGYGGGGAPTPQVASASN